MTEPARFALALEAMDGVGRVTAGRLLAHFATHEELLRYPREQVLARIKGAPKAEALVAQLFDPAAMHPLFTSADERLAALAERRVVVLTPHDASWPQHLDDLPRSNRPFMLYAYGTPDVLQRPLVAFFARLPLTPEPFEHAQALVRHLLAESIAPATGAAHGFDVVMHKLSVGAGCPSVLVAHCGMARVPPPVRPAISATVRAGGLLIAPFSMEHGPFEHDDRDRALLQAALARACVFVEPRPDTPEWTAMTWAVEVGRPVFGWPAVDHPLPEQVHPLRTAVDFDWVLASVVHGQ